jgi:3'-phosphoadenosine 5'-phosphosulfate synthase
MSAPTDVESVALYTAPDDIAAGLNNYITNHPLAKALRVDPSWHESRPHLRYAEEHKKHSLTAGTLLGHGRIPVPPLVFVNEGEHLVSMSYLGTDLCGHVGIVHGGLLATLLDEGLARCGFAALPNKIGVTASLTVNYKKPTPAGSFVVLKAETTKVEGRKVWVKGRIELLGETEEPGDVLVEAEGLFVEPKYAKVRLLDTGRVLPKSRSALIRMTGFTQILQGAAQIGRVLAPTAIRTSHMMLSILA